MHFLSNFGCKVIFYVFYQFLTTARLQLTVQGKHWSHDLLAQVAYWQIFMRSLQLVTKHVFFSAGNATINAAEKKEKWISYVVSRLHSPMMSRDTPLQDHHFPPRPSPSKATLLHDVRTPPTKDTPEPRIPTPPLVSGLPHPMLSGGTPKLGGNDVTFLQTLIGGHLESIHFLATWPTLAPSPEFTLLIPPGWWSVTSHFLKLLLAAILKWGCTRLIWLLYHCSVYELKSMEL